MYIAPYVAASIAEEYMEKGLDVVIFMDDLRRHADAYREFTLLMEKMPGREAYPAEIFYIHSRLLERATQHQNGGSITMLPLVETKSGDFQIIFQLTLFPLQMDN
jgi:F-type H+-transporting ATPase subunit alpha